MSTDEPLTDNSEQQRLAEAFADEFEAKMQEVGVTGKYFCEEQRKRWRQHAIRAFLGLSPHIETIKSSTYDAANAAKFIAKNPYPPEP